MLGTILAPTYAGYSLQHICFAGCCRFLLLQLFFYDTTSAVAYRPELHLSLVGDAEASGLQFIDKCEMDLLVLNLNCVIGEGDDRFVSLNQRKAKAGVNLGKDLACVH